MRRGPVMLVVGAFVAVLCVGCTTDGSGANAVEITEVTFDGSRCVAEPDTAPAGTRAFVLTNTSDIPMDSNNFFVVRIPDGHSFDDLVAIQDDNGGAPKAIPENIWYIELDIQNEALSFAPVPEIELGDDQSMFTRELSPGTDAIELYVEGPPELQWLCGPIEVTTGA